MVGTYQRLVCSNECRSRDLTTYLLSLSGREARRRMAAQLSLSGVSLLAALPRRSESSASTAARTSADMCRLWKCRVGRQGLAVRTADRADGATVGVFGRMPVRPDAWRSADGRGAPTVEATSSLR
jgi:hypothetical protein